METIFVTGIAPDASIVVNGVAGAQQVTATGQVAVAGPQGPPGADGTGSGGGSGEWGAITGDITSQNDLQTSLGTKLTKTSNLSDVSNPTTARTNLGLGIGTDVQAQIPAATSNDYYRGDKTFQNFNTAVRNNRLDQMAAPGATVPFGAQRITNLSDPTSPQDAATKFYVDAVAQGLSVKTSVVAATTAALATNTYSAGVLTASANAALTIDGVSLSTSDRVLVKDEVSQLKNGIYSVTTVGDGSHPYVLTRATDMDANNEVVGAFTFVTGGSVNANSGWIVSGHGPFTIGTTAITFAQFSSSSVPDATTLVKGKVLLGAPGGAATFESVGNGVYMNVKNFGALGDGSNDDTTSIQDAIDAALAMTEGVSTVYFPAGTYVINDALVCTSATGSGGVGVILRGDGKSQSKIYKGSDGFCAVTYNGSGGPDDNSTSYGGLIDITVEGGGTTGGLFQANSANQMFFRGFSLDGGVDFAMDLNTCQDSYFSDFTSNSVHSASAPIVHIYGSADGNTNQLFFSRVRIEDFYGTAIQIEQGSGGSSTNNGFYFDDLKLETGNVSGDFFVADDQTLDLHIDTLFGSANAYKGGYSTPISLITTGAYQSVSYRNIYFNDGIGGQVAALNAQPTGGDFGVATAENVWYNGDGNTGAINFGSTVSNMVWTVLGNGTDGTAPILSGTLPYQLIDLNSTVSGGGSMTGELTGAFIDKGGQVYNVKAYGALGDGSTDDYAAIVAAISAANSAGGGYVDFPPGTYMLSEPINLGSMSNIYIRSQGKWAATIQPIVADLSNFNFSYLFGYGTTGSTSTNITIDGLKLDGNYQPTSNVAGGIKPGYYWLVQNCYLTNFNYFPMWIDSGTSGTKILRNRWSGQTNGTDNIGGGGHTYTEIAENIYEADSTSNCYDTVGGNYIWYHHNIIKGNNTMYVEAQSNVDIHDNRFIGSGGITVQSDKGYGPTSITNASNINIRSNKFYGGGSIKITMDTHATKTTSVSGNMSVIDNYIYQPPHWGILIHGGGDDNTRWGTNFVVTGNRVINANDANNTSDNTGYVTVNSSGINVAEGFDVLIADNLCIDTRGTPQQRYGIEIGETGSPGANNQPDRVSVFNNHITGVVTAKTHRVSTTFTPNYYEITDAAISGVVDTSTNQSIAGNKTFTGATAMTAASGTNNVPLAISQNDTANNPNALTVNNVGTGIGLKVTGPSTRTAWIGNNSGTSGASAADNQFFSSHADSTDIAFISQRNTGGSGTALLVQNLGTGTSFKVTAGSTGSINALVIDSSGNVTLGAGLTLSAALPIAQGGTGSASQNFVDISTNQSAIAGNKTFTGVTSATAASSSNQIPLNVTQNDTSNNPDAFHVTNNGTGAAALFTGTGTRKAYLANTGGNTGVSTADYQFFATHADAVGIGVFSQRSSSGSGDVLTTQNLGTGVALKIDNQSTGNSIQVKTNDLVLKSTGLLGIGQATPTAYLDLPASTTSNASLRIRSGSAPTSPNTGEIWFDGTHLQFRNGSTTDQLDGQTATGTAGGDLSGTYPNPTVAKINGTSLGGLATGILKNTTTTGVPSIAVAADFPTLNQDTTGKSAKTDALNSATTVVNVAAATAPSSGQVLTATDSTHATWQPAAGGAPTGAAGGSLSGTYPNPTVATNANLTGPITSSGNATSIASQTGTGTKFVMDTSPSLVTPTLGVASATTINKVTLTAPATGSTLTILDGKTLTASNTLTLAGTDSTVMTFPSTSATIARTDAAQTFTGVQTGQLFIETAQTITVSSNAGTADVTHKMQNFTNSSAATMAITLTTTSAVDGQTKIVRIYDFSAVAQTIGWTNTENSSVSAPTTSNGSTTLPLTVGFIFNGGTSKWRCVASV